MYILYLIYYPTHQIIFSHWTCLHTDSVKLFKRVAIRCNSSNSRISVFLFSCLNYPCEANYLYISLSSILLKIQFIPWFLHANCSLNFLTLHTLDQAKAQKECLFWMLSRLLQDLSQCIIGTSPTKTLHTKFSLDVSDIYTIWASVGMSSVSRRLLEAIIITIDVKQGCPFSPTSSDSILTR